MSLVRFTCALLALLPMTTSKARAIDSCTLPSVGSVVFGGYDALLGDAIDSTGSITYYCTGSAATISISINQGNSSSFSPRQLQSGAHTLSYNVYLEASRSTIWGDGANGTGIYQETAVIGANTLLTVFGRIFSGQNPYVGSYSDSLVVTVSF